MDKPRIFRYHFLDNDRPDKAKQPVGVGLKAWFFTRDGRAAEGHEVFVKDVELTERGFAKWKQ